jgi:hypothetical protein
VVRERGLGDLEQRDELAHADLARVPAEHVDELQAHRIAERLGDLGHAGGLHVLHVGIDDGHAARLAGRPLLLRGKLQIDRHRSIYID